MNEYYSRIRSDTVVTDSGTRWRKKLVRLAALSKHVLGVAEGGGIMFRRIRKDMT
jgi:ubiquinone/menaquinone biosynthesis C-methylase UbiE